MNIAKIRYFLEVAECGNFSEAARRLYTAQPNISKQIAQMEQEVGFLLFERNKRSVKLTPAGQIMYNYLKDLPDELDRVVEQAKVVAHRHAHHLSIGILEGQEINALLLTRLNLAQELNPKLEIEMERSSFSNLRSGLKSGHYDMIVTLDFDVVGNEEYRCCKLYSQPPAIAIHRDHPLANEPRLTIDQLKDENFVVISPAESPVGYDRLIYQCRKSGFTPNVVKQPRSLESLILLIEMGVGVAILDQGTRLSHDSAVRTVPIPGEDMFVVAACLREDTRPILQQTMELLKQHDIKA